MEPNSMEKNAVVPILEKTMCWLTEIVVQRALSREAAHVIFTSKQKARDVLPLALRI